MFLVGVNVFLCAIVSQQDICTADNPTFVSEDGVWGMIIFSPLPSKNDLPIFHI